MVTNKILVIGPAWVGDMVMAQALFKLLKTRDPQVIIDVMAPSWSGPLLARMPEVRQALTMPLGHVKWGWRQRWELGCSLRHENYQQAIVLPNSWKSALVPFVARIPRRTGWLGEWRFGLLNDVRYLNKKRLPLMVQRFLALGIDQDVVMEKDEYRPLLQVSESSFTDTRTKFNITISDQPIIALCPGAEFGSSKRWPAEHYAEVAKQQHAAGAAVWLFGSAKDQPIAAQIQQATQNKCVDFTGRTSLGEAVDLLSLTSKVVTNDSGLMHIAAALQRPLVVIYGSSSPQFTPPLSDNVKILSLGLSCSPCFQRECPLGHWKCVRDLSPHLVLDALTQL